jgi:hypothetical protein
MVELALALPILLLVIFGIVDFGRAINYWNDENSLANVGARYAAVGALPTSDPTCPVTPGTTTLPTYLACEAGIDSPELKNGSGSGSNTGVHVYDPTTLASAGAQGGVSDPKGICVSVPNNSAGQEVTVQVAVQFDWLPLPKVLGGTSKIGNVDLKGTATMRLEAPIPATWITTTAACT